MAKYFIFDNTTQNLSHLAINETARDWFTSIYPVTAVEATNEQYLNAATMDKVATLVNGQISEVDSTPQFNLNDHSESELKEYFQKQVDTMVNRVRMFVENNPDHAEISDWSNYLNNLKTINIDNVNFSLTSVDKYLSSQAGFSGRYFLELP